LFINPQHVFFLVPQATFIVYFLKQKNGCCFKETFCITTMHRSYMKVGNHRTKTDTVYKELTEPEVAYLLQQK
jgi:hypothetical protein